MINLQNIKIGKRIGWGFGIILAVMAVVTATALHIISDINDKLDHIVRVNNEKIRHTNEAIGAANSINYAIGNIMLAQDDAIRSQQMDIIKKARTTYGKAIEEVEKLEVQEEGKKIIASSKETIAAGRDLNNRCSRARGLEPTSESFRTAFRASCRPSQSRPSNCFSLYSRHRQVPLLQTGDASTYAL